MAARPPGAAGTSTLSLPHSNLLRPWPPSSPVQMGSLTVLNGPPGIQFSFALLKARRSAAWAPGNLPWASPAAAGCRLLAGQAPLFTSPSPRPPCTRPADQPLLVHRTPHPCHRQRGRVHAEGREAHERPAADGHHRDALQAHPPRCGRHAAAACAPCPRSTGLLLGRGPPAAAAVPAARSRKRWRPESPPLVRPLPGCRHHLHLPPGHEPRAVQHGLRPRGCVRLRYSQRQHPHLCMPAAGRGP